jgi:hypothetical protein
MDGRFPNCDQTTTRKALEEKDLFSRIAKGLGMLDEEHRMWGIRLLFMNGIVLGILALIVFLKPMYRTTAILRVSVLPGREDPNNEAEMAQLTSKYQSYKLTVVSRLSSDIILSSTADTMARQDLELFRDSPNRNLALRQAIKNRELTIENTRSSERITLSMASRLPSDTEVMINSLMDSCLELENATSQTQKVLEDQQRSLLRKMEQPDQKDKVKPLYDEVTRRIDEIKEKSRRPGRLEIETRAQSVPVFPQRNLWILILSISEVLLLVALIGNLVIPRWKTKSSDGSSV